MNSHDDRKRASTLTALLRAELRNARFSLAHLAPTNTKFVPNELGWRHQQRYRRDLQPRA